MGRIKLQKHVFLILFFLNYTYYQASIDIKVVKIEILPEIIFVFAIFGNQDRKIGSRF